jgi:hypothetical protein
MPTPRFLPAPAWHEKAAGNHRRGLYRENVPAATSHAGSRRRFQYLYVERRG